MSDNNNAKERRLYFDDLWVRIKKRWVLVLIITLVCGVLLNLLGYYRNSSSNSTHLDQSVEELRELLSEEEIQDVEKVLEYLKQIRSTQAYLEDSALIKLDAMSIPQEKLTYQVSSSGSAATQSCRDLLTGRDFLQQLAEKIQWTKDAAYLGELITVNGGQGEITAALPNLSWGGYIDISVCGITSTQAEQIADFVHDYLSATKLVGNGTCTLVARTQTVTIDLKLLEKKSTLESSLNSLKSTCDTKQAKLNRLQKDLLIKEMDELGLDTEDLQGVVTEAKSESILQPKYLVLGLLFGLVLGVFAVMIQYLFSKNVRSAKDMQNLVPSDYIAHIDGEEKQTTALFAAYIQTYCAKRDLQQVTLLAAQKLQPTGEQALQTVRQMLEQSGIKTEFFTMDTQDPAVLKQILLSQCIVPVAEIDRTDCSVLQQEMNICRRDNIPVPAGIVL